MNVWVRKFKEKVKNKIKSFKKSKQIYNNSLVLQDERVRSQRCSNEILYCPIDKTSNNFPFICKKFYVSRLLYAIGLCGTPSDTCRLVDKLKGEVIDDNITLSSKFDL